MQGDRHDQQHQRRCVGNRLVHKAVEQRTHRHQQRQRERNLPGHGQRGQRQLVDQQHKQHRVDQLGGEQPAQSGRTRAAAEFLKQVDRGRGKTQPDQQPNHRAGLARLHRRHGQRAVGDEFPLGNQQHPCHGKHQHDGQRQQCVNCAVGDAILAQECSDLEVHATIDISVVRDRGRAMTARPCDITSPRSSCRP